MEEIVAPDFGESVFEASVGRWFKSEGDSVASGEPIVELHTDKAVQEINTVRGGVIGPILKQVDDVVRPGDTLCEFRLESETTTSVSASESMTQDAGSADVSPDADVVTPAGEADTAIPAQESADQIAEEDDGYVDIDFRSFNLETSEESSEDAQDETVPERVAEEDQSTVNQPATAPQPSATSQSVDARPIRRERLSRRRITTARRMAQVQAETVMTTTYNEVDMIEVIRLRREFGNTFMEANGIKLGFMSFFVKAVLNGLKAFPIMNAELDGDELVYKDFYDIGVAVASDHGLVVPVVRDAEQMSFADIEREIRGFAEKARTGSFSLSDLLGGTFTITNGGVFGSMMSTPILNPPQVGILGMHNIVDRPVVVDGLITIRPMMYLAVTYDHRVVEGAQAVQFLMRVKQSLEAAGEFDLGS